MRGTKLGVAIAALVVAMIAAAPARATTYQFVGDKGTKCSVEVGANATHGGGLLATPNVGFSASPICAYADAASTPGSAAAGAGAKGKACKAKRHGVKRRHCWHKKAKHRKGATRATSPLSLDALLDLAKLKLLGPIGLGLPGAETLMAGLNGYTCVLGVGSNCSDTGNLTPAVPGVGYFARYSIRITPPAGETWVVRPSQCSAAGATECVLTSESVSPTL